VSTTVDILGVLQARASSSRLPGKVLKPLVGEPMLIRQLERLGRARKIGRLIVATSTDPSDDVLAQALAARGIECHRGSLDDVLDRFYRAAAKHSPKHVVRLTGDCPLADPVLIDQVIEFHLRGGFDYSSSALEPTYPDGLDVEVATFAALETAFKEATTKSDREHVMPFLHRQPARFKLGSFKGERDLSMLRWTVDEADDFDLISQIYEELYPKNAAFSTADVLALLERRPALKTSNTRHGRNEGYALSQRKEELAKRYRNSEGLLERALKHVPLGSQTFSKSITQYPRGVSPYFIKKAKGSRAWDVDGNEYLDFVNALCAISLGHADPDVNATVKAQLDDGVLFTLPHPLEIEVAETICEMVPCAEMVRFGKNGSDATAGAVRVARAFTGHDHVAVCGYHGWQDWYIGSTARNRGVPKATQELTHVFPYNDLEALERTLKQHPGGYAAVIMEPMNVSEPAKGYLESVKRMAHEHGALLIFDETITGFRYANGGAQELLGVTPDLATFGKAMANGYPLSAVAGRADVMKLMEEIFFSFTFGGETLSLAASLATMKKLKAQPVIETMTKRGTRLIEGLKQIIADGDLGAICGVAGHPTWSFLLLKDAAPYTAFELKTLYLQETLARGLLCLTTHNMSYAHSDADVDRVLAIYREVLPMLKDTVAKQDLNKRLCCKPLQPLFKVR
jgi:glutamate-1-semialdehyde 2,1-aminomutase/spore coat polysaccharide biosynthesis protein SpsF